MALKNLVDQMTALEVARRSSDPNAFTIIETMSMANTMLQELPAVQANDGAVHTTLVRRSYPGGQHRIYNRGVGTQASQSEPVKDIIAMLEAFSDVDEALARHSGNANALYQSEAIAFLSGMGGRGGNKVQYQARPGRTGLDSQIPEAAGKGPRQHRALCQWRPCVPDRTRRARSPVRCPPGGRPVGQAGQQHQLQRKRRLPGLPGAAAAPRRGRFWQGAVALVSKSGVAVAAQPP